MLRHSRAFIRKTPVIDRLWRAFISSCSNYIDNYLRELRQELYGIPRRLLHTFLSFIHEYRFALIFIGSCFLAYYTSLLTLATLGESFIPFGLAATVIPFCTYTYEGIFDLIHYCGYEVVTVENPMFRTRPIYNRPLDLDPYEPSSQQPLLYSFNNRFNNQNSVPTVLNGTLEIEINAEAESISAARLNI